ncbi:MAG: D-ribose pyranase [Anaerolineaceae bacterium]|jgi:D-ribose pyranase|nr:MAG: D-ribose pyranase [Anaerolineaceae bacterium]
MKKEKLLNPEIVAAVAALGHTEYLCIADCGLPIPQNVNLIDVSVTATIPSFLQVLKAVESELVVESYICASEIEDANPNTMKQMEEILAGKPAKKIPHEDFKTLTSNAKYIIRTGETSPYANVILVGGVNF